MNLVSETAENLLELIKTQGFYPDDPLPEYILEFDENMDNPYRVRNIGQVLGFFIESEDVIDAPVEFYTRLSRYIKNRKNVEWKRFPTTREIIDMTRDQFKHWANKMGISADEENFSIRTDLFIDHSL